MAAPVDGLVAADRAAREPNVHLVTDTHADVTAYMLAADVLISDASSTVFEFLALDRPIILVTNPLRRADPAFDADGIIWQWRDVGDEVGDVAEVPAAVERALGDPGRHAERRAHYAARLFGPRTDGRSAERIAAHVLDAARAVAEGMLTPWEPGRVRHPVVWRWHDLRYAVGGRRWPRRTVLGWLERLRFRRRGRAAAQGQ